MPPCVYKGIDLVSQSVEEARQSYPDLSFECANLTDITDKYDWVFLIAITASIPMPEVLIKKAWELSTKGMIVDFLDPCKDHRDYLNTFKMGACTDLFLEMGAQRIELYPTRNLWNVFVVHKAPFWL
ncbi:SAM-dependent methyltransferase domain-containing protein [Desulfonema magnum]|uniref:SAM-dependent methyltransferase domain-containing protein n=2 Tax=Desulfonema magnum TaxID=45655 RepID=A0A975GLZ3_9BACT|nr:SAM-dependent methyltransferase domain-containing protein [Desulfonema magnum]